MGGRLTVSPTRPDARSFQSKTPSGPPAGFCARAQKQGGSPERHRKASACHLKHCCLLDRRLWPEKGPANKAGPSSGSSCARTAAWMEVPAPPRACPQIASVELVPWFVRSRITTGGAATTGRFQAWSRHRCVPCQTFVRLSLSARPVTHLREGDHGPRCSSQK
jgi:hypothetical protein